MSDSVAHYVGVSVDELSAMLRLVAGTDISELDITLGSMRVSLRRVPVADHGTAPHAAPPPPEPSLAITSPLVGIFRPSVVAGDSLQAGQSIGSIEALGMPTSVDAPQGGTVEELLVSQGSPVEYGQPLLILRRG